MRTSWRRLLWIAAAVTPVAAIAVVGYLATRDLSRYQTRITEQVRKVTGRDLTMRVPLKVKLGTQPSMVAEGVVLTNASWGSRPELARVRKITLFLDPVSLLLGEVKIGRMLLEGADILVERTESGDSNLEMLPPPDGSGPHPGESRSLRLRANPAFPWVDQIELRDSLLTVREHARPPVVLEVAAASLRAPSPAQALNIDARLRAPQAVPLRLTGSAGSFDGWMRGLPGNIDLQGGFGTGTISIKGTIGAKGTSLAIASEGPDFGAFGPYLSAALPSGGPYAFQAKVLTHRNGLKVEVPQLKIGSSELVGEATFRPDRSGQPTAVVAIEATRLDLADLRAPPAPPPTPGAGGPVPAPADRRWVPAVPFAASWLGRQNLTVNLRVGELAGLPSKVQSGSLTLASSEQRFAFRGAATVGGGSAGFDLVYDASGRLGQATLTATANRVSLQELGLALGVDLGLGESVGDVELRLRGSGRNSRDALNAASGTIDISMGKAIWPADALQGLPAEQRRLLGGDEAGAPINCVAGRFEVTGGVAWLRRLAIDTPKATLVGGGFVHLRAEAWEFLLVPEARDNRDLALAVPVRVRGGQNRVAQGTPDANVSRLIIPAGVVPSLTAAIAQAGRQTGVNACANLAPRVDGFRPGLRAQMPTPSADLRDRGPRRPTPQPQR
ncbi:MAG: AsmA family protein [Alphaproteobacteria bacterium]|nr:AsmA family protein [Alphaproteobacteria bacterium]